MKDHPQWALLLPSNFEDYCEVDIRERRNEVTMLSTFPYVARVAHPESLRQPICDYIRAHYKLEQEPAVQNFDYGLWTTNDVVYPR